jgi:predicted membrane protein
MTKYFKLFLIFSLLLITSACSVSQGEAFDFEQKEIAGADVVKIINFHSIHQCYACIYLGQNTLNVIKKNFPEKLENNKIIFKKINTDDPVNRNLVFKYKARGSSLFFNEIREGEELIYEDVNIWRFLGNDKAFEDYLIKKIEKIFEK